MQHGTVSGSMTVKDAAQILGVTPSAVSQMIAAEKIPSEKIDDRTMIKESVINEYKGLKEKHGRKWFQHASWNEESAAGDEVSEDGQETEGLPPPGEDPVTVPDLIAMGKRLKASGYTEISCQLFEAALDGIEFE